ncbi:MAG: DUF4349 domain-containing protein [Actinobacteria bacterium]|nr:DUF4349 domain-containing protein [Actinomycetota bacterium]
MTERTDNHGRRRRQKLDAAARHELDMVDRVLAGVQTETADDAELASFALRVRGTRPELADDARGRVDARFAERIEADRVAAAGESKKQRHLMAWTSTARGKLLGAGAAASVLVAIVMAVTAINENDATTEALHSATSPGQSEGRVTPESAAKSMASEQANDAASGAAPSVSPVSGTGIDPRFLKSTMPTQADQATPTTGVRRVERSAELTLATASGKIETVADKVIAVTDRYGGFVVSSSVSGGDAGSANASFSLKLPAERFQQALAAYSGLAHVRERTQQTQDITDPYRRATSRVSGARAESARLRALLAKASDADAASLRSRLRTAENRLTARERELSRLRNRVNFVTLGLTIVADETAEANERGTIHRAFDMAVNVLESIAALLIVGLAIVVPVTLVAVVAIFARRRVRRARGDAVINSGAAGNPPTPPPDQAA